MATTEVPWSTHTGFGGFVRRQQEPLVRGAYLVCGDVVAAEEVTLGALVEVGRRWDQAVEEEPERLVRRSLYRAALGRTGSTGPAWGEAPASPPSWDVDPPGAEELTRHREVADALGRLTPRGRGVLALLALDGVTDGEAARVLRTTAARVRGEADTARQELSRALPGEHLGSGPLEASGVRRLLEEATSDLPVPDLVETATRRAGEARRSVRRRGALVAGGLALGTVAAGVLLRRSDRPARLRADEGRLATADLDGVLVHLAPDATVENALPAPPDPLLLDVPQPLGPGDPTRLLAIPVEGVAAPVVAVYLVHDDRGRLLPVVQLDRSTPRTRSVLGAGFAAVDTSTTVVGPRTIADDRARLVFPAPARVVVVDVRAGTVSDVELPDPTLRSAGWARDGRTIVVQGRDDGWLVDPVAGEVLRTTTAVFPDRREVAAVGGVTAVRSFADDGTLTGWRTVPGPRVVPFGLSAASPDGWVAAPVYLPGAYQDRLERSQGVVAVPPTEGRPSVVLAGRAPSGGVVERYRVLGWAPGSVLLVESRSLDAVSGQPVRGVLAWDVPGARLLRVGPVRGVGASGSWFTGQWAL